MNKKRTIILIIAGTIIAACLICFAIGLYQTSTPTYKATKTAESLTQTAAPTHTLKPTKTTKPTNTLEPTDITQPDRNTLIDLATQTYTPIPLPTNTLAITKPTTKPTSKPNQNAPCNCTGPDLNCPDFKTRSAAQTCFNYCKDQGFGDPFNLDRDGDGRVCEN